LFGLLRRKETKADPATTTIVEMTTMTPQGMRTYRGTPAAVRAMTASEKGPKKKKHSLGRKALKFAAVTLAATTAAITVANERAK
jgi:hypothetical protein